MKLSKNRKYSKWENDLKFLFVLRRQMNGQNHYFWENANFSNSEKLLYMHYDGYN